MGQKVSLSVTLYPLCPKCRVILQPVDGFYGYSCEKDGLIDAEDAHRWNGQKRVVWLRSSRVSHTGEVTQGLLMADGTIRDTPALKGFKWEPWP